MNKKILLCVGSLSLSAVLGSIAVVACTITATVNPVADSGPLADVLTSDSGNDAGGDSGFPAPPTLGTTQIDRMGRPAINTALNNVFEPMTTVSGPAKDAYNAKSDPTTWSTFKTEAAKNLAVFDSLDTVCGNQLLATLPDGGLGTAAGTYDALAGALSDDRVYTNAGAAACTTYLAVEANATGVILNSDCGGRTLAYDVIDVTYSVVAVGATTGVTDGIGADTLKTGGTTFPYLSAAK